MKRNLKKILITLGVELIGLCAYGIVGEGTRENPYQVSTLQDFLFFRDTVNAGYTHACAELHSDIDLSSVCYYDSVLNAPVHWKSIGGNGDGTHYEGRFDGKGHVVKNIYVNSDVECYCGIFGSLHKATILNAGSENVYIKGGYYVAGIAGVSDSSTIVNCYAIGYIKGYFVSGIVGSSLNSNIYNCYSLCSVQGNYNGCVAGYEYNSSQSNCHYDNHVCELDSIYNILLMNVNSSFKDGTVVSSLNEYVESQGGDSLIYWHTSQSTQLPILSDEKNQLSICYSNEEWTVYSKDLHLYVELKESQLVSISMLNGFTYIRFCHAGITDLGEFPYGVYLIRKKIFLNNKTNYQAIKILNCK